MKITGLVAIATFTFTIATGSGLALAETTGVSRCDLPEGAAYKPGLWITKDGITRLVKVGEESLTRRIIYDDTLARRAADHGASTVIERSKRSYDTVRDTFIDAYHGYGPSAALPRSGPHAAPDARAPGARVDQRNAV